jgi:uncharacterized protein (TIGR02001 family)
MSDICWKAALLCASAALGGSPKVALAANDAEAAVDTFDLELVASAVSDYRFRGISTSDTDFAIQGQFSISHETGLYGRIWGSNIADNGGDNVEVDLVAGFALDIGSFTVDVGATWYLYPGATGANYGELIGTASKAVGPATIGVTFGYAPKQAHLGNQDNVYVALNGSLPLGKSPFAIAGSIGFEDGAFGDRKKDWSLGITAEVSGFTLGASYVDTAHAREFGRLSKAGAVFSISRSF